MPTLDEVREWAARLFEDQESRLREAEAIIKRLRELIKTLKTEVDIMTKPWVDLFASDVNDTVYITTTPTNTDLPSVVVPALPTGCVLSHAYLIVTTGCKKNTYSSINLLSGAQNIRIKISTTNWGSAGDIVAINLVDYQLGVAPSTMGNSDLIVGDNDIKAIIPVAGGIFNIRIQEALALGDELELWDVQCFIKLVGTVK